MKKVVRAQDRTGAAELEKAVALARNADVAVVCVGTTGAVEMEGARPHLARAAR